MKIMLVQFAGRGGMQLYVSQLANALSKKNDVSVLLAKHLFSNEYYSNKPKILLITCPPSNLKILFLSLSPWTYLKILRLIKIENPDVIHAPSEFLWIAMILPFLGTYPFIVTEHDPSLHKGIAFIQKLNVSFSRLFTRRRADAIIVHGNSLKNLLIKKGISHSKVHVIPHGEFSFYKKWAREEIKESKSILCFGSIRDYKGLPFLIEAASQISDEIPEVRVVIAGEGEFSKYAALISTKENQAVFEIHNRFIPDQEVAELFQKAAVVVLPYTDGSQTGVVPIAYSFGKPVVVTNVGSLAEAVDEGKTGFIVPPRDSKSLARALIRLLNDDQLRRTMGKNALLKVNGVLSWESVAEKTLGVYEEALRKKMHPRNDRKN